jgi:hypothetical protein
MPQLCRVRLCNIGHVHARIDDLILSLHDAEGQPTHSTIWLRNGGGKTMLVSLLLWLLCPEKKMPDNRRIEEYVQSHDRSVLVAEWQLDSDPRQLFPQSDRFLTGVFCEWRSSLNISENTRLRHFFFVTRVLPQEPRLTLDHLPLYVFQSARRERRTLASFRQEWQDLSNAYPQAHINETEQLSTWRELLEQAGIDPELFGYQILMNRHEAEAEALFKFRESDQFVDFFLELMGNTQLSNTTAQTIEKFREALRRQSEQLEPEYHLVSNLIQQLNPLRDLVRKREQLYLLVQQNRQQLGQVATHLSRRVATLEEDLLRTGQQQEMAHNEALRWRREAAAQRRQATLLRYAAARKSVERLQREEQELHVEYQQALRMENIWYAAEPLRKANRAAAQITFYTQQQTLLQQEHAPLLQQLQQSARRYASALDAKIDQLRAEEHDCDTKAAELRYQARAAREQARDLETQASLLQVKVEQINTRLKTLHESRSRLEKNGTLLPGETWQCANERLEQEQLRLKERQQLLQAKEDEIRQILEQIQQSEQKCTREAAELDRDQRDLDRLFEQAERHRRLLTEDQSLRHYLEVDEVDVERLDQNAVDQLRHTERAIEDRLARVKVTLAEHEAVTRYLSEYHLLPPSPDVARVLAFLKDYQLTAWSGWEYLTATVEKSEVRTHLRHMPELAFGVVVRDAHYQQAEELLQTASLSLDTPVIILSQQTALDTSSTPLCIIGPSSDAYFDRDAGERELLERETQHEANQRDLMIYLQERDALRQILGRLEQWLREYSSEWWQTQRTKSAEVAAQQQAYQAQLEEYRHQLDEHNQQLSALKKQQAKDGEELIRISQYLDRLDLHKPILTEDPEALEQEALRIRGEIADRTQKAEHLYTQANDDEIQEQSQREQVKLRIKEASIQDHERSEMHYLEDTSHFPQAGDIPALREEYLLLIAQYEQRIGKGEIDVKLEIARKDEKTALQTFHKRLKKPADEAAVRAVLRDEMDDEDIAQQYRMAVQTSTKMKRNVEDKQQELEKMKQVLSDTRLKCQQADIPELEYENDILLNEEECKHRVEEAERQAESFNELAHAQENSEREATERVQNLKGQKQRFEQEQRQIQTLLESYSTLLEAASGFTREGEQERSAIFQDEEIDSALLLIGQALNDAQREEQALDTRSKDITGHMRSELNRTLTTYPKVTLTRKFLDYREEDYERLCDYLLGHLTTRKEQIETDRAEVQQHRELIVQHLLDLADKGLALLKSAMTRSKLPEKLSLFEQRPFLKISFKEPPPDERRERVEALLERIIREGKVPGGLELLQQAVRRLASPINVDVLFPDPHAAQRYVPIAKMAKESGGERLTSTVLLYCTLVQLRAFERAQHIGATSSLILDNPIGAASHPMLLELQREVAQVRRIQLIYTTAVKDFDAIRMFPNIIRVRNDRRDAKSGERLMELDTSEQTLQSLRLVHSVEPTDHDKDARFQA